MRNSSGIKTMQGLHQCRLCICGGYDLEKLFDTVNQSKQIEVLSRTIKDGRVVSFIHRYLNAGVVIRGRTEETEMGVPQGGLLVHC